MDKFLFLDMDVIASTNYPVDQEYSYPSYGRKSTDFMFSKGCFRRCEFCVAGGQKGNIYVITSEIVGTPEHTVSRYPSYIICL